ncbi:MAG: FAD-dependent oxidoreductase [Fimbriimonas ginsengisoli]|uniref:FAD-dependent oxidoreductase n=1 Tax=Fimbriimonas ginsengisoli TaxID=1005039 RepID=A0A931LUU9_FIMGI|nr:FAD-dependent oxidoreductase [Fimbriimonas ginsengisoli]
MDAFDVVVCGGGTAGAAAAIASARVGASTLVIEQLGMLGGTQTGGWVTPLMPNYLGAHKLSRGLNLEILREQTALQPAGDLEHGDDWYDPVALALVLDRLAIQAGVTCLFNATLIEVRTSGGISLGTRGRPRHEILDAVEIAARGGRRWIEGKCFIDATGDGELSALAGAELMSGNAAGEHQPMTLRFAMGNLDLEALREGAAEILRVNTADYVEAGVFEAKEGVLGPRVNEAIEEGILAPDDLGYFQFFSVNGRPGELAFNAPRIAGLDPLDPFQMSRAYQVGRAKIFRIANFVRAKLPGCAQGYISAIAPLMGIRESRRVVGDYVLTEDDHQSCRKFDDAVARNRYPVDIHLKEGADYRKFPPGEWHDIPYRSLVVRGLDNLWVAGRCLSADFVAQSAVRIQPVCRATGEAAGIAAALCAARGVGARELPYGDLAARLDLSVPEGG